MKKNFYLLALSLIFLMTACSQQNNVVPDLETEKITGTMESTTGTNDSIAGATDSIAGETDSIAGAMENKAVTEEGQGGIGIENDVEVIEDGYSMTFYTEAPNQNSSINIQYPNFIGDKADVLNKLIHGKVQELAKIDTSLFSGDSGLTIDYQSEVTLQNEKIVSIIFWGPCYIEGGAYETNNLYSLNVDLQTMEEVTFEELYSVDEDFEKIFFANAFFPTNPITSYDETGFAEMLRLQSPEYQTISPFSISGNVSCFLKPDGIVLSMPAIHATGNDHFEAQLRYSDIEKFYLADQKYWENPG